MIRNFFKKKRTNEKLDNFLQKYNIPRSYLSTTRKNVARAVFIGIFIGLIPAPGHMLSVIALMPFARFNVPIALSMVWINNPITMVPIYYLEYKTGAYFLGTQIVEPQHIDASWFFDNLTHIFLPLYAGTIFYSLVVSAGAYFLINFLWKRSVNNARYQNRLDEEN